MPCIFMWGLPVGLSGIWTLAVGGWLKAFRSWKPGTCIPYLRDVYIYILCSFTAFYEYFTKGLVIIYNGIYTAYLKHINVCERTVLTVLKSILNNTFHHGEGCHRPEDVKIRIFVSSARRQSSRRW